MSSLSPAIRETLTRGLHLYHERQDRAALEVLLPLARLGVSEAQDRLAKIYVRGCTSGATSAILLPRAVKWFDVAATHDHPLAQFESQTIERFPDIKIGISARDTAALTSAVSSKWEIEAQSAYAIFLRDAQSNSTVPMGSDAQLALAIAAEAGLVEAMRDLGFAYWAYGDKQSALVWAERAALGHSVSAQYGLGLWYATDKVVRDPTKAMHWYKLAVSSGSAEALFNLGQMLLYLSSSSNSIETALQYITHAAILDSKEAQMCLARCYSRNIAGIEVNPPMSEFWRAKSESWVTRTEQTALNFANLVTIIEDL